MEKKRPQHVCFRGKADPKNGQNGINSRFKTVQNKHSRDFRDLVTPLLQTILNIKHVVFNKELRLAR